MKRNEKAGINDFIFLEMFYRTGIFLFYEIYTDINEVLFVRKVLTVGLRCCTLTSN